MIWTHNHLCIVKREVLVHLHQESGDGDYSISFIPDAIKDSPNLVSSRTLIPLFARENGDLVMVIEVKTKFP